MASVPVRTHFFNVRLFIITLLVVLFVCPVMAQVDQEEEIQSVTPDSVQVSAPAVSDKLKALVAYSAKDSMLFDIEQQIVYLWDSAKVTYEQTKVMAHFIRIDFKNNIILANGMKDSLDNYTSKVQFEESGQTYFANQILYNYETGKGKISEVSTIDGENHIIGEAVHKDTNFFFIRNGQYTTCDLEHPHFSIRARKLKIIQNDKIVTGPAYLQIADVPTLLAIPFGFFPNKKTRTSGVLIPTYGESPELGFFLRDGGYYWGGSEKFDLALRGDIYSRGSWGTKLISNYNVRYKYSGNFSARYSRFITGDVELPSSVIRNDFFIDWRHVQDTKANPNIRFSADVNAGTSNYNRLNSNNFNNLAAGTFQSNVAWSRSWKYITLATNLRHSQNTQTGQVDLTLPQVALTTSRLFPFRSKTRAGSRWYDKIGLAYTADLQNLLSANGRELNRENLPNLGPKFKNGLRQTLPVSTNFNLLRYFTLTPQMNLNSVTQFRTIRKFWDSDSSRVVNDTVNGIRLNYDWNASLTLGTRIFGTYNKRRGKFSAIRHTITPNIIASYMPDFTAQRFGFWKDVQSNANGGTTKYSIFEGGIYGSSPAGRIGALGFNLQNNLEAKLRPKESDTVTVSQRQMLIDALNFTMNYNFMAENFQWSPLNMSFRTRLFRRIDLNANCSADPYRINELGTRIDRFEWRTGKRLARLTSASLALGTSLRKDGLAAQTGTLANNSTNTSGLSPEEIEYINANPNHFVDFNVPWSLNMGYNLTWSKPGMESSVTQVIRVAGDLNFTPKWKVGFDSSYDLKRQEFGFTSLNLYRDLHCWEMQFNWIPFGFRQSYNITIQVKASALNDLKLTRKRDWFDFSGQ